jgi:hypothetical protein
LYVVVIAMDELEEVAGGIHRARHGVGEGNVDLRQIRAVSESGADQHGPLRQGLHLKKWKRDQIIISQNP